MIWLSNWQGIYASPMGQFDAILKTVMVYFGQERIMGCVLRAMKIAQNAKQFTPH